MPSKEWPGILQSDFFALRVTLAITALKLLLIPAYHSTDFEVHRNWMAITSSLPLSQWYTDATSEWTLDYPPLFAWFERLLAFFAPFADQAMLEKRQEEMRFRMQWSMHDLHSSHCTQVENLNYASPETVLFQRGSVIVADIVLATGVWYATRRLGKVERNVTFFLVFAHPGLLIVDHIHFQYNGFLLGILLWSIGAALQGQDLVAGLVFAVLVNLKHLYATLGPVYVVYLLRHYCRGPKRTLKFLRLATGVAGICAASFGPFIAQNQLSVVLRRLFPFGRGLCHAYWAANVWALYAGVDKAMCVAAKALGMPLDVSPASMTGGLVGKANFGLLPDILPLVPLLLTGLAMLPSLASLWKKPQPQNFALAITSASLSSFMLGYHVHEKAALTAVIPAALSALTSHNEAGRFLFLSTTSTFALLPLLFTAAEYPVKILLLVSYTAAATWLLSEAFHEVGRPGGVTKKRKSSPGLLGLAEWAYLGGLIPLELYCSMLHGFLLSEKLPFLPLMLTSLYCACGMLWIWAQPVLSHTQTRKRE